VPPPASIDVLGVEWSWSQGRRATSSEKKGISVAAPRISTLVKVVAPNDFSVSYRSLQSLAFAISSYCCLLRVYAIAEHGLSHSKNCYKADIGRHIHHIAQRCLQKHPNPALPSTTKPVPSSVPLSPGDLLLEPPVHFLARETSPLVASREPVPRSRSNKVKPAAFAPKSSQKA